MYLEGVDPSMFTQEAFEHAAEKVKGIKGLDNESRLQLYGLYKQTQIGDVNTRRPWALDMVGQAKWDAWESYKGMPQVNAGLAYIFIVDNFLPGRTKDADAVAAGVETDVLSGMGVTASTMKHALGDETPWSAAETLFDAISDENMDKLQGCLASGADVNMRDDTGMSALHYAVDRGLLAMVHVLLDSGAALDAQDHDGQTALMYAVTCEHTAVVQALVASGADTKVVNSDGETVFDFQGVPEEIRASLGG